jgi:hypothetical protein
MQHRTSPTRWLRPCLVALTACTAILLAIAACGIVPAPDDPSKRNVGPYLQIDSPDSVVVSWFTPQAAAGIVEVLDPSTQAVVAGFAESDPVQHHAVHVTGLPLGGSYLYRLAGAAATNTDLHELHTPPFPGTPLHLDLIGDSGGGSAAQYAVAAQIVADRPDYILHAGDVVYPAGADANYDSALFLPYAGLIDRAPLLPCIGNHDVATLDGAAYLENFILPRNGPPGLEERCYSLVLGDLQLVSVDRTRDPQLIADTIVPWLRGVLSQSTTTWRVLMFHHPVYHSGSRQHSIVQADIDLWGPLCDELNIDLCLTGHNHFYERSVPLRAGAEVEPGNGTVYVVSGNGGEPLYTMNAPASYSAAHNDQSHGFVKMLLSGRHLELAEIDEHGQTLDATSWDKPEP